LHLAVISAQKTRDLLDGDAANEHVASSFSSASDHSRLVFTVETSSSARQKRSGTALRPDCDETVGELLGSGHAAAYNERAVLLQPRDAHGHQMLLGSRSPVRGRRSLSGL
jgi:hypothetical protein